MSRAEKNIVKIGGLELEILDMANDEYWYNRRDTVEEINSRWYQVLANAGFKTLIDVGANYGMIGAIAAKRIDGLRIIAVEPDPRLIPLIKINLEKNGAEDFKVIHAVVTDREQDALDFSLNPQTTLDNRVEMESWEKTSVAGITLDGLIGKDDYAVPIYIKIDTQGYEERVFRGAEKLLRLKKNWLIKAEFAPSWLESQGTDPEGFLAYLLENYSVYECPQRFSYSAQSVKMGLGRPICHQEIDSFVDYIRSLNRDDLGWIDIIVMPKTLYERCLSFFRS